MRRPWSDGPMIVVGVVVRLMVRLKGIGIGSTGDGECQGNGQGRGGETDAVVAGLIADLEAQCEGTRPGLGVEPDARGQRIVPS